MRIYRRGRFRPADRGAVVAIGNFDGVHRGHMAVLRQIAAMAAAPGWPRAALTFEPHPRVFLGRAGPANFRLTPLPAKLRLLAAAGIDCIAVRPFDHALAAMSPESFCADILAGQLGARMVVVGENFRFGRDRAGNTAMLQQAGRRLGFEVRPVALHSGDGDTILASSRIRADLGAGRLEAAAVQLGRWWEMAGRVRRGDRRGTGLGFPTANISPGGHLLPANGVYAVRATPDPGGRPAWIDGVANLGQRPTVGGTGTWLETHLFDYRGDLYGRVLRVALVARLRPEKRFDGLAALKAQIDRDIGAARTILDNREQWDRRRGLCQ